MHHHVVDLTQSQTQGERNAYSDAVSRGWNWVLTTLLTPAFYVSGLDNAGKTTIVKRVMNEDVTTVSPTLGFIIRTVDFQGLQSCGQVTCVLANDLQLQIKYLSVLQWQRQRSQRLTLSIQGTLVARKPFDPIGGITLRRPTLSFGSWMPLTMPDLVIVKENCRAYCWKR